MDRAVILEIAGGAEGHEELGACALEAGVKGSGVV
jgi:hypothetical protein